MNRNDIEHLAEVSKMRLSVEEIELFENEINEFLKMTEFDGDFLLSEIKESKINFSELREEVINNYGKREEFLKNAEKTEDEGFVVPKVF